MRGKSLDELSAGGASGALHRQFEEAFAGSPFVFTDGAKPAEGTTSVVPAPDPTACDDTGRGNA